MRGTTYQDLTNIPHNGGYCDASGGSPVRVGGTVQAPIPAAAAAPIQPRTAAGGAPAGGDACAQRDQLQNNLPPTNAPATEVTRYRELLQLYETQCNQSRNAAAAAEQPWSDGESGLMIPRDQAQYNRMSAQAMQSGNKKTACRNIEQMRTTANRGQPGSQTPPPQIQPNEYDQQCAVLGRLSEGGQIDVASERVKTLDGAIECKKHMSYTYDFNACKNAARMYDGVKVAEKAMDMQQMVRTESKNREIQAETAKRAAEGDLQAGAFDAGISQHEHMKKMNTEKMIAYGAAVAALVNAYRQIPGQGKVMRECQSAGGNQEVCNAIMQRDGRVILANQDVKGPLATAIAEFTAKGLAAGIAMGNNRQAAETIAKAKQPFEDEAGDLMLERCQFNPADPACLGAGERISGGQFAPGEFSLGNGAGNALNMNPEGGEFGEVGAETNLDDANEVASINNPFADDAKRANDILNPAGAAQVTPGGAAGGGSGGGAGGGLGGGGASLGSDLAGADKDGDGEPKIKTGKVSGAYGSVGGGGYRGIARSKENANPFASLFDQKGSAGGTEVEGVEAGISGKASGLFQKISSRYTKIHADKRIEAKNLE